VVVYHISGCGQCDDCRRGYQISCTSAGRAAYGWQRNGGHADLLLAEERDLLVLPDELTFVDGACVACGFGTAYEALCRLDVSGRDRLLVVGLGPVGNAAALMGKAMGATTVVGVDVSPERRQLAVDLGAVDVAVPAGDDDQLGELLGDGAEAAIDCSGNGIGQLAALKHTRRERGRSSRLRARGHRDVGKGAAGSSIFGQNEACRGEVADDPEVQAASF